MNSPIAKNLVDAFNAGLEQWGSESSEEWKGKVANAQWNHFRISEVGNCMALQTYRWRDREKDRNLDTEALQRMYDGEEAHVTIRDLLQRGGLKFYEQELRVTKKVKVGGIILVLDGHIDNVSLIKGERFIIDYKKSERFSFEAIQRKGPGNTYIAQVLMYMWASDIKRGFLFFKPTHGVDPYVYEVKYDPLLVKGVLLRLAKVAKARKEKRIAPREYVRGLPPCTYCEYETECWRLPKKNEGVSMVHPNSREGRRVAKAIEYHKDVQELEDALAKAKGKRGSLVLPVLQAHGCKTLKMGPHRIQWVQQTRTRLKMMLSEEKMIKKRLAVRESYDLPGYPKFLLGSEQ